MPSTAAPGPRSTRKKTASGDDALLSNSIWRGCVSSNPKCIEGGVVGGGGPFACINNPKTQIKSTEDNTNAMATPH